MSPDVTQTACIVYYIHVLLMLITRVSITMLITRVSIIITSPAPLNNQLQECVWDYLHNGTCCTVHSTLTWEEKVISSGQVGELIIQTNYTCTECISLRIGCVLY